MPSHSKPFTSLAQGHLHAGFPATLLPCRRWRCPRRCRRKQPPHLPPDQSIAPSASVIPTRDWISERRGSRAANARATSGESSISTSRAATFIARAHGSRAVTPRPTDLRAIRCKQQARDSCSRLQQSKRGGRRQSLTAGALHQSNRRKRTLTMADRAAWQCPNRQRPSRPSQGFACEGKATASKWLSLLKGTGLSDTKFN